MPISNTQVIFYLVNFAISKILSLVNILWFKSISVWFLSNVEYLSPLVNISTRNATQKVINVYWHQITGTYESADKDIDLCCPPPPPTLNLVGQFLTGNFKSPLLKTLADRKSRITRISATITIFIEILVPLKIWGTRPMKYYLSML